MNRGRLAFALGALFIIITEAVTIIIGMSTVAHYYDNDPIIGGRINRRFSDGFYLFVQMLHNLHFMKHNMLGNVTCFATLHAMQHYMSCNVICYETSHVM